VPGGRLSFDRFMTALRALIAAVDWAARTAVVLLVTAMLLLVASQFVDRYVHPIWRGFPADEYVKVALIWLTFIGFGLAMRAGTEIRVDFVDHRVAARARAWMYGFFDLLLLAMLGLVLWKSVRLYDVSTLQTILGTEMTVSVPVLGLMLGCALMLLAVLTRFLRRAFGIEL
jgi:TRAP-type C4-dicarboxylate transport system permease small subunit